MDKHEAVAQSILDAVGGKENIASAEHCMSRLRLVFKDQKLVDEEKLSALPEVMGLNHVGDQLQIVLGNRVAEIYRAFCDMTGIGETPQIPENAGEGKARFDLKAAGAAAIDYVSGSMTPLLPAFMVAGLFKTIQSILGPTLLNVVPSDSDLAFICTLVFNAVFYFLPIYLGYSAARKLKVTPALGILTGCLLLEPTFVQRVADGTALTVYGIPAALNSYSQTVLPVLLTVWVMSYIERFFNDRCPDALRTTFAPFFTMVLMVPIELCLLAPIGDFVGNYIALAFQTIATAGGIWSVLGLGVLTAFQPLLVSTGMHHALSAFGIATWAQNGSDPFILVANLIANFAVWAVGLAAFLKFRDQKTKAAGLNSLVAGALGGLTEPTLFGFCLRYPRTFIGTAAGGFVAGVIVAAGHAAVYAAGATSVLSVLCFVDPAGSASFMWACIGGAAGFVTSLVVTYFVGFTKEDLEAADKA